MRTVAYYRNSISTEKQKTSIEMQMNYVRSLADKNYLLIDDEFIDKETSARKTKAEQREGMKRLTEEIRKGKVKNLIVYSRCRLARNVQQYMELYYLLREHKINVFFAADFEIPMSYTVEAELIERILAAINQVDAEKLVQKLADSKITRAKEGKHAAGRIPFGFRKPVIESDKSGSKKEWEKVESELKKVEIIYDLFLSEDFTSFPKFVDYVNEKGLLFRGDKEWTNSSLRTVLSNPIYKGVRLFHSKGEEIQRTVKDLQAVSDYTWEKVQIKLNEIVKERDKSASEIKETFLLNGLVFCSECNSVMAGKMHKQKENTTLVYKCQKHSTIRTGKDWLEQTVIEEANDFFQQLIDSHLSELIDRIYKREASDYLETVGTLSQEVKRLEDTMADQAERALEESKGLALDVSMVRALEKYEQYLFLTSELEYKIKGIKEKFESVNEWKNDSTIEIIREEMNDDEKIELIQDIVSSIQVGKEGVTVVFQHPLYKSFKGSVEIGFI